MIMENGRKKTIGKEIESDDWKLVKSLIGQDFSKLSADKKLLRMGEAYRNLEGRFIVEERSKETLKVEMQRLDEEATELKLDVTLRDNELDDVLRNTNVLIRAFNEFEKRMVIWT